MLAFAKVTSELRDTFTLCHPGRKLAFIEDRKSGYAPDAELMFGAMIAELLRAAREEATERGLQIGAMKFTVVADICESEAGRDFTRSTISLEGTVQLESGPSVIGEIQTALVDRCLSLALFRAAGAEIKQPSGLPKKRAAATIADLV